MLHHLVSHRHPAGPQRSSGAVHVTDDPAFAGVLVFLIVFLRVRGQQHLQNQNAPVHQAETGSEDNIWRPRSSFRVEIHGVLLCKDLSSSSTTSMSQQPQQWMMSPPPTSTHQCPSVSLLLFSSPSSLQRVETARKCLFYSPDEGLIYGSRGRINPPTRGSQPHSFHLSLLRRTRVSELPARSLNTSPRLLEL